MMISKTLICIFLPFLLASCSDLFQTKIPMGSGNDSSLSDILLPDTQASKLEKPSELFVSREDNSSSIRISWSQVSGASSYLLERATVEPTQDKDGNLVYEEDVSKLSFDTLREYVYTNSYTDIILPNPNIESPEYSNRYYYRVTARTRTDGIDDSDPTDPLYGTLFSPPLNASADLGLSTAQINIRWSSVSGASEYRICRAETDNAVMATQIGTVYGNRTKYTDIVSESEQGIEYYYYIYAVSSSGSLSIASNSALGFAKVEGAPEPPAEVFISPEDGRGQSKTITVEWTASDVENATYLVYRTSSSDSTMTRLTPNPIQECSYTDATAKTGLYYYYQIQTLAEDPKNPGTQLKSAFSQSGADSASPAEGFIISPPTESGVTKIGDSVTVKWLPAIGNEEEQKTYTYLIHGSDDMTSGYEQLAEISASSQPTGSDGYLSAKVEAKTYYKIQTVNSKGEKSAFGSIMAPSPAAATLISVSKAANIDGAAANSSGVYGVQLTWKKPATDNPYAYNVYRTTAPGGGYRKINSEPILAQAGTDTYTYIDNNDSAKVGKYYYYKVLAVNLLEQGINYSEEQYGYGALTHEQYIQEFNKTIISSQKKMDYFNRPGSTDKLGKETVNGDISGTVLYDAGMAGLGARIIIQYTNYADTYTDGDASKGAYFTLNGNCNTSASMDQSGTMDGTITCTGMYPGKVRYDKIQIKGGAAGGGTYGVQPDGFENKELDWTILN